MQSKKFLTVPNILSCIRIILIPVFMYLYFKGMIKEAFIIFFLSGVTDIIDGFIARKFNQISDIGKVLDPMADKITILCILGCLYYKGFIHWLIFGFMLIKESFQIIGGIFLWKKDIVVYSNFWGKATTVMLYAGISSIMLWPDIILGKVLLGIAVILATISVVNYTIINRKIYNQQKNKSDGNV